MLELLDLLRDWLSGDIKCQVEDVNADGDYILFNGTVTDAFRHFRKLSDKDDIEYEVYSALEIDPSNGLLYIQVREM